MIILKHLTVERFRLLREMNLHFPLRGSILIQGPNESGKSALLESIYFALYGEPFSSERGKRSLDDLVLYGAPSATITLTFSVGATEFVVTRTIERGKGQKVALSVHRLGTSAEEPITRIATANERIIAELGCMDGPALRNSCFIEQKGLERLESLSGGEREATIRKLLGLEKLLIQAEHFKVLPADEWLLKEYAERLRLAETQDLIPRLRERLTTLNAALDAITISQVLREIDEQEADIAEQEQSLEQIQTRRLELKTQLGRVQQLKKADATLGEIIGAYEYMAEARRELPELEKQIAELERREREELPLLERRVNELSELTRSFGTLQRMSSDLLSAVDTIRELEQELKKHNEVLEDLNNLDEQIAHARTQLNRTQQDSQELEEQRRTGRPQRETHLQNLRVLAQRLQTLHQLEDQYANRLASKEQAAESTIQVQKVQKELDQTEHELQLVEAEDQQAQKQADALEMRWRQLGVRRQVEEWQRLKEVAQGLAQAELHVRQAYQEQEKLNTRAMEAHNTARRYIMYLGASSIVFVVCVILAAFEAYQRGYGLAALFGVVAIAMVALAFFSQRNFGKAREEELVTDKQVQDATSRVGMMVAAREAAVRLGGSQEALAQVEHEIRSLGGTVPHSVEEAQLVLQKAEDHGESIADLQQRMKEKLDAANATRNQVNVTTEAVTTLRKERTRLEELRKREGWDDIEGHLREDRAAIERLHQEIARLANQEELPRQSVNERLRKSSSLFGESSAGRSTAQLRDDKSASVPELEELVESTVKTIEYELATLDGKLAMTQDLAGQTKIYQEALDVLVGRRRVIEERNARYQTNSPALQIERAREQQAALRNALQNLQDSLRQRVKPLGVVFGQATINNAEALAREQLEALQVALGNKLVLQEKQATYTVRVKEHQDALSEHYKQLSKFSNSLGSWIVPLNPFAEALANLRARCQKELQEANEQGILRETELSRSQEGASRAKIELCRQEIENAQESIAAVLGQHKRSVPKSYALFDLIAVWPLISEYSVHDRQRLEGERKATEQELVQLEQQELALRTQLQAGSSPLDLEQARARMEMQERSYQTKKHGNLLVKAVNERLMQKMPPRTEYYMQQILPLLTSGRYRDVHLTTQEEKEAISGGPFQWEVWDSAASEYVTKAAISGGTADQISLALRLAFAIAVLPRELTAAPGFVVLDEPLSSFDRGRTRALVDVVTGDILSQHFEQIILISHSNAFDPTMFPYHVYMDNGVIIESNLPVVSNLSLPKVGNAEERNNATSHETETAQQVAVE